jgi:hypothetical protein
MKLESWLHATVKKIERHNTGRKATGDKMAFGTMI